MSGRRLRDNVGCACHLSGQGALHCAQIGKTPNLEGPSRSVREGRSSAEVAHNLISVVVVVLSISNRSCDNVWTGSNCAFFFALQKRGGDKPE